MPPKIIPMNQIRLVFLVLLLNSLAFCQSSDPNKQVDEGTVTGERYESKEVGWTIVIPKEYKITSKDAVEASNKRGQQMLEKSTDIQVNTDSLKQLINFGKDKFNNFGASSQPFRESYPGEYGENAVSLGALIYETFTSQGIKCDTSSGRETFAGLEFYAFRSTIYSPSGKPILYQVMYNRLINGLDFAVNINYNNEKDKKVLMEAWEKSKFK